MTPAIAFLALNRVLKRVTCGGENVYELVQQQKQVRAQDLLQLPCRSAAALSQTLVPHQNRAPVQI